MSAVACWWCGVKAEAIEPVPGWSAPPLDWLRGWIDSDNDALMCGVSCATAYEAGEALLRQQKALYDEEYGNTARKDENPDRTARARAAARMVRMHGKDWELSTRPARTRS